MYSFARFFKHLMCQIYLQKLNITYDSKFVIILILIDSTTIK